MGRTLDGVDADAADTDDYGGVARLHPTGENR